MEKKVEYVDKMLSHALYAGSLVKQHISSYSGKCEIELSKPR